MSAPDVAAADDFYKLATDGRYWPAGFLDGDNGLPGTGWDWRSWFEYA